jgi:hypothetical protein
MHRRYEYDNKYGRKLYESWGKLQIMGREIR